MNEPFQLSMSTTSTPAQEEICFGIFNIYFCSGAVRLVICNFFYFPDKVQWMPYFSPLTDLILLPPRFQMGFTEVLHFSCADDFQYFLLSPIWWSLVILSSLEDRDKDERLGRFLDTDSLYRLILLLQTGLRRGTDFLAFCLNITTHFFSLFQIIVSFSTYNP